MQRPPLIRTKEQVKEKLALLEVSFAPLFTFFYNVAGEYLGGRGGGGSLGEEGEREAWGVPID